MQYYSYFQIFASVFIGVFTGVNMGAVLGFSAILLPQLPENMTMSEKSWIASICNLGQMVGAPFAGKSKRICEGHKKRELTSIQIQGNH